MLKCSFPHLQPPANRGKFIVSNGFRCAPNSITGNCLLPTFVLEGGVAQKPGLIELKGVAKLKSSGRRVH